MKLIRLMIVTVAAMLPVMVGCAPQASDGVDFAKGFGVDVGFKAVDMCQNVSPEIHVRNVPPETKKLNLKVLDFDFGTEIFNQDIGFETTNNGLYIDGANATIPKGSLYGPGQMPCPKETPKAMGVQVRALDAKDRELANVSVTRKVDPEP